MKYLVVENAASSRVAEGRMAGDHLSQELGTPRRPLASRAGTRARGLAWLILVLPAILTESLQAQGGKARPIAIAPTVQTAVPVSQSSALGTGIDYHGGDVMENPHNVYFVWYGNWNGNTALSILPQFIAGLNGSFYFNTNASYFDNSRHVQNAVTMSTQVFDAYSQGTTLDDGAIRAVISRGLSVGLPADRNGIYFVLTSADVDQTSLGGFCVRQCGYHSYTNLNGTDIKYSFVGNADRCPGACASSLLSPTSPNGNRGADAMASVMAHEINETVTDPHLNAWYDSAGQEVGDKCAWNFGTTFVTPNGANANVTLGSNNYLVQQNWVSSASGFCGLGFGTKPVCYQAYVHGQGWQAQVCDGDVAGTVGQALAIEALQVTTPGRSVCYRVHILNGGWQPTACDGAIAGTIGQAIDGLRISTSSKHVEYFGQVQNIGWTGPAADYAKLGPFGLQIESVVIHVGSLR
jgi:hypothetical protein